MDRIESSSITIFTSTSAISVVKKILLYTARRLKKLSMRSKRSMTAPWLALASFAVYNISTSEGVPGKGSARARTARRTPIPVNITFAGGNTWKKVTLEFTSSSRE